MLARQEKPEEPYQEESAEQVEREGKRSDRREFVHHVLNTSLRSHFQVLFFVTALLAMLVTIGSGISASRGYTLVETQSEATRIEQENERRPSPEELADELEIPVDKISDTLKVSGRHISVDAPFVEGEDNSLLDVLVNDDSPMADRSLVNESLAREIDRALSTLTDREKDIIQMFFGIGQQEMTLEEIGDKFGLTRERVRQIKEKAIRRLRQSNRSKLLKSYLG